MPDLGGKIFETNLNLDYNYAVNGQLGKYVAEKIAGRHSVAFFNSPQHSMQVALGVFFMASFQSNPYHCCNDLVVFLFYFASRLSILGTGEENFVYCKKENWLGSLALS